MKGQWIGEYSGSSSGVIIVNVDELSTCFAGVAYLHENSPALPTTAVFFRTQNKGNAIAFEPHTIAPIDLGNGIVTMWDRVKHLYPNINLSRRAVVVGNFTSETLSLQWMTDMGVGGQAALARSKAADPSELKPLVMDWDGYKAYVANLEGRHELFRGQNKPWRLRTSFHRTGRADFFRFLNEDIQVLHKRLSSRTKHVFNLLIAEENGAFFNMIQHHGYPTPLLDWSYSPYVAAFFAYRGITKVAADSAGPDDRVRIYVFNRSMWLNYNQVMQVTSALRHVSLSEFMAIENERMIPQQACSMLTSVDDIETYVRSMEKPGITYLQAIDLPVRDRHRVVRELRYMGITAGSMFPGLDGMCEDLRERNFETT